MRQQPRTLQHTHRAVRRAAKRVARRRWTARRKLHAIREWGAALRAVPDLKRMRVRRVDLPHDRQERADFLASIVDRYLLPIFRRGHRARAS